MKTITIAICTYNRANNLKPLVDALRAQKVAIRSELLFINNNSQDNTLEILQKLSKENGTPLRYVTESNQGIPYARNRAIKECLQSDYMLFMDDDELPSDINLVQSALDTLVNDGASVVGGRVNINFGNNKRPKWLNDELLPFYAELDHGDKKFCIKDKSTPIWTSIIAYDMNLFRDDKSLRFDIRYNRTANGIGGGEDAIMFREMLKREVKMMYQPEMSIDHFVEPWRMKRTYFWKLHFIAGRKYGQFETPEYKKTIFGIPPFMFVHAGQHFFRTLTQFTLFNNHYVRQGMNLSHALGQIYGRYLRYKDRYKNPTANKNT